MKKITYPVISIIILILITACAEYKPIYTTDLQFRIADYSIKSNKKLGRQIYSKLYNLSKRQKNSQNIRAIKILIDATKNKNTTSKDSAGKILEYKIELNVSIKINDFLTNNMIIDQTFISSTNYKAQDQYFETIKLENASTENLINNLYQKLLIELSQNI